MLTGHRHRAAMPFVPDRAQCRHHDLLERFREREHGERLVEQGGDGAVCPPRAASTSAARSAAGSESGAAGAASSTWAASELRQPSPSRSRSHSTRATSCSV